MKIQATQDYSLFKRIAGNRALSKPHIERLLKAIEEDPETTKFTPIIVNDDYKVIDGQHRLEALERLNLPVHYIKVPGAGLTTVQRLNSVSKMWSPTDYAKSFRELGNKHYQLYLEFKHEFGFNHDVLLKYMSLDNYASNITFKEGKFKCSDPDQSWKLCEALRDIAQYYQRATYRNQSLGFLSIVRSPHYDHKRMVQKIKTHVDKFTEQKTAVDYAREYERIYNYGSHGEAIRLF